MKYLAALAALFLPAVAQATTHKRPGAEFVYECQIEEICKSGKCTPAGTPKKITLKRHEGASQGTLSVDGNVAELHVFKGLGSYGFLQITNGGSVGYTIDEGGALSIRATVADSQNERGSRAVG